MSHVYETPKPSTWAALRYMGAVCRALWADHRASVRTWRQQRQWLPPAEAHDTLHWLAVAAAAVAALAVLVLTGFDLWADFSAWMKASGAALLLPTAQADRRRGMLRLHELAARPQGVSNAELQADLGINCKAAAQMLYRGSLAGLAQGRDVRVDEGRLRWFGSAASASAWFDAQATAFPGVDIDRVHIDRVQQAAQAQPPQAAPKPRKAPKPKARGPNITLSRPPKPKPTAAALQAQAWAAAPAVVTAATRVTVAPFVPEGKRINRMADPLPGVPGWGRPAPVRDGAMDFKRHMHQAQAFTKPAHLVDAAAGAGRG